MFENVVVHYVWLNHKVLLLLCARHRFLKKPVHVLNLGEEMKLVLWTKEGGRKNLRRFGYDGWHRVSLDIGDG